MTTTLLTALIILSVSPETPIISRRSEADPVYRCDFEEGFDQNFDNWPNDWTRRRGPGFPFYLPVEIVDDTSRPTSKRCLKLELDGGAALVYSPRIAVKPLFSYVLHASLRTEQLEHDVAYCAISFLDDRFQRLVNLYLREGNKHRFLATAADWAAHPQEYEGSLGHDRAPPGADRQGRSGGNRALRRPLVRAVAEDVDPNKQPIQYFQELRRYHHHLPRVRIFSRETGVAIRVN